MIDRTVPHGWKKTILVPLVRIMFKSCGSDLDATWKQAIQLLEAYAPKTDQEFRMAVRMAILNAQGNLCFAESVDEPTTQSQAIRLRSIGLTTLKAADKAELRLEKLQTVQTRKAATATTATATATTAPAAATAPTESTAAATATATLQKAPPETTDELPNPQQQAPHPGTSKAEARMIRDYARKKNIDYAKAWGLYQREKKAAASRLAPA
jgi:hypothetical protein